MTGLQTARVAVIDDVPDEALPLVHGLGRRGIGCVYISGDKLEELPEEPLRGLRLLFLDMDLGVGGPAKQVAAKLIGVLKKVIGGATSPVAIAVWTDHPEYVDEFKCALARDMPDLRPGIVNKMAKPFKRSNGQRQIDAAKAMRQVEKLLGKSEPLALLWAWEQLAHDASTDTTRLVSEVADALALSAGTGSAPVPAGEWLKALKSVLRGLVRATAGKQQDDASAARGFLGLMSSLHLDRLEELGRDMLKADIHKACSGSGARLPEQQRAELNTRLLVAATPVDDKAVRPGNVYLLNPTLKAKCPVHRCRVDGALLAEGMTPKLTKDAAYGQLHARHNMARQKGNASGVSELEAEMQQRREQIVAGCVPTLIEVTPSCDFSQNKRPLSRFVGALAVPDRLFSVFDWGKQWPPYLRAVDGIVLPGRDEVCHLILNAKIVFGLPAPEKHIKSQPACRLRESILTDMRSWLASYGARPGYTRIEP